MKTIPLAALYLLGGLSVGLRPNIDRTNDQLSWSQLNTNLETAVRGAQLKMDWEKILVGKTVELSVARVHLPQCNKPVRLIPVIHGEFEIVHWVHLSRSIAEPHLLRSTHHAGDTHKGFIRHRLEWNRIKHSAGKLLWKSPVQGMNATVISELPEGCALPQTLDLDAIWRKPAGAP